MHSRTCDVVSLTRWASCTDTSAASCIASDVLRWRGTDTSAHSPLWLVLLWSFLCLALVDGTRWKYLRRVLSAQEGAGCVEACLHHTRRSSVTGGNAAACHSGMPPFLLALLYAVWGRGYCVASFYHLCLVSLWHFCLLTLFRAARQLAKFWL